MDFKTALNQLVGSRIKIKRAELGLSQDELASKIDLARASISNIEIGRQQPTLSTLYDISQVLETDVQSLLPTYLEVKSETISKSDPLEILKTKDVTDGSKEKIEKLIAGIIPKPNL
ncbi:DNA-binding transcriptional regulator, XRE-family HTH domain [Pedobacter suwonensis]|uniref:DNA-binding transcriptional regulator, XRE-family HTH domain n=1 Tax=Pedobacter suwonensis TaxID=332999 RepID=A0A1I0U1T3_9SPHI|nr:helix-turn-helix transcriptional regulator [Pedobacter suwonensis]MDQ0966925.1 transcriptional regulator with XRE-family HTH domain [Flavobacterium sp. W4I14]SFA57797.1 DNA-binding transcriptional regulator, XRE-family HTH domain [Pedobacter suwonensis]